MGEKKKKIFALSDKSIAIINSVKEEKEIKTDVKALEYILQSYANGQVQDRDVYADQIADKMLGAFREEYYKLFERLRWATRTAELNSTILLDSVNTILVKNKIDMCVPVETFESKVIETSRNLYQKKLDHFKQQKEDRKLKNGNE